MLKWVRGLPLKVLEGLIVAGVLAGGAALGGVLGDSIPVWTAGLVVLVAVPMAYVVGGVITGVAAEDLAPYYAEHVREALETFQSALAGAIPDVTFQDWIERGILAPAKYWLAAHPNEDVRLMIVEPDEAGTRFVLEFEVGHSVEARQKFDLEIAGSFAGTALASGQTEWTNDVDADERWRPHPNARSGRQYGSLASVPIRIGPDVVAVLNVVSTMKNAFTPGDLHYVEVLGSLVSVAYSMQASDDPEIDEPE